MSLVVASECDFRR